MKQRSDYNICNTGTILECKDGYTWVYIGYRTTTVGTFEHHFVRCDFIPVAQPLWTYKAVNNDTLKRKFPDLNIGEHNNG